MPPYLLIIFSPLIFKIIFDKYVYIVILNVQLIPFLLCFFCFSFCSLIISFYFMLVFSFLFLWIYCIFFTCGYHVFQICDPLLYLFPVDQQSYRFKHIVNRRIFFHFLTLLPYILWFWMSMLLHLHVYHFVVNFGCHRFQEHSFH